MPDKQIDPGEITIAQLAVRRAVDKKAFGHLIGDATCQEIAAAVVAAIESYRSGKEI